MIIEVLMKLCQRGYLKRGKLNLVLGSEEAYKLDQRGTIVNGNKIDLNRLIGVDVGPESYELDRQKEIVKVLDKTDLLVDVHATQNPTAEAFMMIPEIRGELAYCLKYFGSEILIEGAFNPSGATTETDLYVNALGKLGITIEAGYRGDPDIWKVVFGVLAALQAVGMFDLGIEFAENKVEKHYKTAKGGYVVAGNDFKFTKKWENFEVVAPNTVFAYNDGIPLSYEEEMIIVFAKDVPVKGAQACLIVYEV